MAPTKQEIEEKLRKMAGLIDNTVSRASNLLDAAISNPKILESEIRTLGKQSAVFIKKQKLELEIRVLKLRLMDVENQIEGEMKKKGKDNTRP